MKLLINPNQKFRFAELVRKVIIFAILVLFISPQFSFAENEGNEKERVLLISSYHPAFPTFFEQIDGLKSVFDSEQIEMDIEFMDSKRYFDPQNLQNFYNSLSHKILHNEPYDAIVITDDNALNFLNTYHQSLFPEIPAVFCGVNDIDNALKQNSNENVTGVVEAISMYATIELMLKLKKSTSIIYAIIDETPSGQGDLKTYHSIASDFPDIDFRELSLSEMTFSEFSEKLRLLDSDSAVLLLSAYRDKAGNSLDFNESLDLIRSNLKSPLYHLWYHGMGNGVLGGKLISHFEQAKTAANLVKDILDGTPVTKISVIEKSPNRYIFDYHEMERFNLKKGDLPDDSIILNEKLNFYELNKTTFWLVTAAFLILIVFFITLLFYTLKLRKIQQELLISDEILKQIPETIILLDMKMNIRSWSGHAEQLLDQTAAQTIGRSLYSVIPDNRFKNKLNKILSETLESGDAAGETKFTNQAGKEVIIDLTASLALSKTAEPLGIILICRDITERKQVDIEIKKSQQLLHKVAENYPNSYISIIEKDFTIGFSSGSEFKKSNLNPDDFIGLKLEQVFGEHSDIVKDHYIKTFAGEKQSFDLFINNQYQQYNTVPLTSDDGSIERILSAVENITERRKNEMEMKALLEKSEKHRIANLVILNDLNQTTNKLKAEVEERKKAEEQIEKDLAEKTALLQELYHRTKNNMAVISAMLSMQSMRSTNGEVKSTFLEIGNKIEAMSLVHQKLYKEKNLSNINFKEYVEDLSKLLLQSYGILSDKVNIILDLQDIKILIDIAIPMGLIINELFSNVFKHAFGEKNEGEITIQLFKDYTETINFIFSDDGVGLPKNFDVRKDGSMGLTSVIAIAEDQLKGVIDVNSDNGLKWHIKIKDNLHKERI